MADALWFLSVIIWMALGGWAFQTLEGAENRVVLALLCMCLVLGPFLAGYVLGERNEALSKAKEGKE